MIMSTQIYIGELTRDVTARYLEREFAKFGKITNFSFKGRFAFVDYERAEDAEKAVSKMHNERFEDAKLVVEFARKSEIEVTFQANPHGVERGPAGTKTEVEVHRRATSVSIATKLVTGKYSCKFQVDFCCRVIDTLKTR